jgi:carbamate kinase
MNIDRLLKLAQACAIRWPIGSNDVERVMAGLAVVAIGGNSLIRDPEHRTVRDQYEAATDTCKAVARMISEGWDIVLTHGNGPQVGFILRRSELSSNELHEVPLDVCGADTQGAIGYMLQQQLQNELHSLGVARPVATIVTQVEVDETDAAFGEPTKPIGSAMSQADAERRRSSDGWSVHEDAGRGWRRVVASPAPRAIVELEVIRSLLGARCVVIAAGGGGVPVARGANGRLRGIEAVIDKDRTAALLAAAIGADLLLISTAVDGVALDYGSPEERWLDRLAVDDARRYLANGAHFASGSMKPKVLACVEFLEACPGASAVITRPDRIAEALRGAAGTRFAPVGASSDPTER